MDEKWNNYYTSNFLPWDSGRPSSQLVSYFTSCICGFTSHDSASPRTAPQIVAQATAAPIALPEEILTNWIYQPVQIHVCEQCMRYKPTAQGHILELGCGTGASAIWLARQGFNVTAIDIVQAALKKATAAATAAGLPGGNPTFQQANILDITADTLQDRYDMIYDCQVYHALIKDQPEAQQLLSKLLFDLLKPGGVLLMLTGNANEPEIGPAVLTGEDLLTPLLRVGFECVFLRQTRFDCTDYYVSNLKKRPLAWWVVLQRPCAS